MHLFPFWQRINRNVLEIIEVFLGRSSICQRILLHRLTPLCGKLAHLQQWNLASFVHPYSLFLLHFGQLYTTDIKDPSSEACRIKTTIPFPNIMFRQCSACGFRWNSPIKAESNTINSIFQGAAPPRPANSQSPEVSVLNIRRLNPIFFL